MQVIKLGQTEIEPVETKSVGDVWLDLRTKCEEQLTPGECDGLMGTKAIYFEPSCQERFKVPFWAWLIGGYLLGKQI